EFLLDDRAVELRESGPEIAERAAKVHSALRRYPSDGGPRERQLLEEIEESLSQQESISSAMLSLTPGDRKTRSPKFIQEQLLPRSLSILQVSQQIASLNGQELAKSNQDLLARFASLQSKLKSMLLAALTAGLVLSLLGTFYVLHLERQERERYLALADNRLELEKLSARLLDIQEQERRSIARELHDEVGQSLEALLVDLGRLSRLAPANEEAMRGQIANLKTLAENSVKTVRDIALLLRPSMLDDLGLIPALEWQAREVSRRGEMEVEVHPEMVSEHLPDEIKICVYRLVQEALNNAAAHASAKNARVSVTQGPERLEVEITDDHQLMRSGLRLLIEQQPDLTVVGEAADGREAVALAKSLRPDVAVMDISMPNLNGIEAAHQITQSHAETAVIVLSMHPDESYVLRALKAGAKGYLLKDSAESDLIAAIRGVARGKSFFSPAVSKVLLDDYLRKLKRSGAEDAYD